MRKSLIQQQIYVKETKGLFLTSDDSDTVAVSPHLKESFVKKYLHPICTYQIPSELKKRNEKDKSLYPPLFTMIQPETGDLVVGQASFVPAENPKQKNRYFVHNYVIPADRKEEWIYRPSQIFQINHLASLPEPTLEELEEMENVPYRQENIFAKKQELFHHLQLDETLFKRLLFACISAVEENKRIYITFQSATLDQNKYAMWLLELLYTYLPYETRRVFGATTFHNEPVMKENVNMMFVEPGSIRLRNKAVEQQYVFDLLNQKITGIDSEVDSYEFLNYAYSALETASELDEFFVYCERALKGLDKQQKLNIHTYNDLYLLFYLEKLDYYFYDIDKGIILEILYSFLQKNHREKEELVNLFSKLLHREELMKDASIVLEYMRHVFEIQRVVEQVDVVEFTVKTIAYHEGEGVCKELWDLLEDYPVTYYQVLSYISDIFSYSDTIDEYLKHKFSLHHSLDTVLENIHMLLSANSSFEHNAFFLKWTKNRLVNEVKKSSQPISVVSEMGNYFHQSALFHSYKKMVLPEVKSQLLVQVQLEKIKLEDVKCFGEIFLREKEDYRFTLKGWEKEKYEILEVLYTFFFLPLEQIHTFFRMASSPIKGKAWDLALELIKENGLFKPYERFLLLFPGGMESIEHRQVFSYIAIYGTEEEMLDYIQWSLKKFSTSTRYNHALKDYLVSDRNSIWKKKEMQKELTNIRSQSFKKLLKEVRDCTSNPMMRFFRKYGLLITVGILILAGCYFYLY